MSIDPYWLHIAQMLEKERAESPSIIQSLSALSIRSEMSTGEVRRPVRERLGRDISALGGLNFGFHEGLPNLAESLARRLITPRGTLFYDRSYGFDVRTYLNEEDTSRNRFELASLVDSELRKDPRVLDSATETAQISDHSISLRSTIDITPGQFNLILHVSDMAPALWEVVNA